MNISGDPAASVCARRSSNPGARSSRWATASGGSPARRATSSTNSLSITSHRSSAATRRAASERPEAYCRVIVMTGGAISGLQVLAQLADVEQWQPTLGRHEDDQVARAFHVVQHLDPLLGERFGGKRLVEEPLLGDSAVLTWPRAGGGSGRSARGASCVVRGPPPPPRVVQCSSRQAAQRPQVATGRHRAGGARD